MTTSSLSNQQVEFHTEAGVAMDTCQQDNIVTVTGGDVAMITGAEVNGAEDKSLVNDKDADVDDDGRHGNNDQQEYVDDDSDIDHDDTGRYARYHYTRNIIT